MSSELVRDSNFFGNAVDYSHENLFVEHEWDSGGGSQGRVTTVSR